MQPKDGVRAGRLQTMSGQKVIYALLALSRKQLDAPPSEIGKSLSRRDFDRVSEICESIIRACGDKMRAGQIHECSNIGWVRSYGGFKIRDFSLRVPFRLLHAS